MRRLRHGNNSGAFCTIHFGFRTVPLGSVKFSHHGSNMHPHCPISHTLKGECANFALVPKRCEIGSNHKKMKGLKNLKIGRSSLLVM